MGQVNLYRVIETASLLTDSVLVSFSGGKDSVVTLDLCARYFKHVEAFFMYLVPGLSFHDSIVCYYENRYKIPIHHVPHFMLSEWLRNGLFRPYDWSVPKIGIKDIYRNVRQMTGLRWIAGGERIYDSLVRRSIIKKTGSIDKKRGRFYPVAEWSKEDIFAYIRQHRLKITPESEKLGHSFREFSGVDLEKIRRIYPADYKKIKEWFPLVDVAAINAKMRGIISNNGDKQIPEIQN